MNQVFLILAHKNPQQLLMLINQLQSSESYFFIHIDKKSKIEDFKSMTNKIKNIFFIEERYSIDWGSFNMIKASLSLINAVFLQNLTYSHAHLLSGEDILIKPKNELFRFFSENPTTNFIDFFKLPCKYWENGGLERLTKYYFKNAKSHKNYYKRIPIKIFERFFNKILIVIFPNLKKKLRDDINYYGGSQWWSITIESIDYINNYVRTNPAEVRFFKYAYVPDEVFFQTILLNRSIHKIHFSDMIDN